MSESLTSPNDGAPSGPLVGHYYYPPPDPVQDFVWRLVTLTPRTFVTTALIAANTLVFLVMAIRGVHVLSPTVADLVSWGGNFGPQTTAGQWWRLVTSMFLHGGLLHLALNMWALYALGRLVERLFGNVGYLLLYLVSGLVGSLTTIYWNTLAVSVGASGAIFGLVGGLIGYVIRQRHSMPISLVLRLRGSLFTLLAFNLIFGFTIPGVDMAAHLGGLGAGLLSALILAQPVTAQGARRRWISNLVLVIVVPPLLVGAASTLGHRIADPIVELEKARKIERKFNMEAARVQRGDVSQEQFAQTIEQKILPEWRGVRQRLDQIGRLPPAMAPRVAAMRRYLLLRESGWAQLAQALREHDQEKAAAARKTQDDAERVLDSLQH